MNEKQYPTCIGAVRCNNKVELKFAKKSLKYMKKLGKIASLCDKLNIPCKFYIENQTSLKGNSK